MSDRLEFGTFLLLQTPSNEPSDVVYRCGVEIATVDLLSEGRLDIGLGRGYQRYEFERFGRDLGESWRRRPRRACCRCS
jgi:alkanesulfonate monooxygenase SsuD/methylene tetrahydromethanopterin reductase-like flavin-dependent oxidoreductase (luciferase family)